MSTSLPQLRQDIGLHSAPTSFNGAPVWSLHDSSSNKFYQIEWPVFEILSRWDLGAIDLIVKEINDTTTLNVSEQDVMGVLSFLERNYLILNPTPQGTARLMAATAANSLGLSTWLLKNYLFIRIPLVRPTRFLKATVGTVSLLGSSFFLWLAFLTFILAVPLLIRHWEQFIHSFTMYRSLDGMLAIACAISTAKVIHELGHAYTATYYGCNIPTMGVALVVMTPMLYTDTNEAWKLTSRSQRLAVGVSGIAAELVLALAATWVWLLLPHGPMRGGAFVLATTTWVMTITLNASPFMRFDGYFLLSDYFGIPNLHQRAFAFGRWWVRELFFGLKSPPPEQVSKERRAFLIVFSYIVWCYRLVVFFGIAVMVYRYFFKVLGVILFAVEIWWFIALPVYREVKDWWNMRDKMRFNFNSVMTIVFLFLGVAVLVVPWKGSVSAPAVLSAAQEQQLVVPAAAVVVNEHVKDGDKVLAGDLMLRLQSPEIEKQIRQATVTTEVFRWIADQQTFDEKLLSQGMVPEKKYEAGSSELAGLKDVKGRLTLRSPFNGTILVRNEELATGVWLSRKEPLYVIADTTSNRLEAFVDEQLMKSINIGGIARFTPDAAGSNTYSCKIADIDQMTLPYIEDEFLASTYGGPISARNDSQGMPIPESPVFRVRMNNCLPTEAPLFKLKGVVQLDVNRKSTLVDLIKHAYSVLIREAGI